MYTSNLMYYARKLLKKFILGTAIFGASVYAGDFEPIQQDVSLRMSYISALKPNAGLMPEQDGACRDAFAHYLDMPLDTSYHISLNRRSATSTFLGKTYHLSAIESKGRYSFASYLPHSSALPAQTLAVLFSLTVERHESAGAIVMMLNPQVYCMISSTPGTELVQSIPHLAPVTYLGRFKFNVL